MKTSNYFAKFSLRKHQLRVFNLATKISSEDVYLDKQVFNAS